MVVSDQGKKACVDVRDLTELKVRLPRAHRRDCRIKTRRVTKARVFVARCENRRHASNLTAVQETIVEVFARFREGPGLLGLQHATGVDFAASDVAVHVDTTRHDDSPRRIDRLESAWIHRLWDNFAVFDPNVADGTIDSVSGVVDLTAGDF